MNKSRTFSLIAGFAYLTLAVCVFAGMVRGTVRIDDVVELFTALAMMILMFVGIKHVLLVIPYAFFIIVYMYKVVIYSSVSTGLFLLAGVLVCTAIVIACAGRFYAKETVALILCIIATVIMALVPFIFFVRAHYFITSYLLYNWTNAACVLFAGLWLYSYRNKNVAYMNSQPQYYDNNMRW